MKLATIGYEGFSTDRFFDLLLKSQIEALIDIRELPLSRKAGFSKGALQKLSMANEIEYIHLANLGCPRNIRHEYRADKDWGRFSTRYLSYLNTQEREIENLLQLISSKLSCILCFEANPYLCHRCYVANAVARIAGSPLEIIHLGANEIPVAWLQPLAGKLNLL